MRKWGFWRKGRHADAVKYFMVWFVENRQIFAELVKTQSQ